MLKRLRSGTDEVGCWLEDQKENRKRQRDDCEDLEQRANTRRCNDSIRGDSAARVDRSDADRVTPPCFRHRLDGLRNFDSR
eukprot:scaffold13855_cov131-Isochrysis_galbana.AAC.3